MKCHALISRILPEEFSVKQVQQWSEMRNSLQHLGIDPIPPRGYTDLSISKYGTFVRLGFCDVFLAGEQDDILNGWLKDHDFEVHQTHCVTISHDIIESSGNGFFWLGHHIFDSSDPLITPPYPQLLTALDGSDYFTRFIFIKDIKIQRLDDCVLIFPDKLALVLKNSLLDESLELLESFHRVEIIDSTHADIFNCVAPNTYTATGNFVIADSKMSFQSTLLLNRLGVMVHYLNTSMLNTPVKNLVRIFG